MSQTGRAIATGIALSLLVAASLPAAPLDTAKPGVDALPREGTLGKPARTLRHGNLSLAIAFSSDGRTLASGSSDCTVKIWDLATGNQRLSFEAHDSLLSALAFSPSGKQLASCSHDRSIRIWDPGNGKRMATLLGHEGPISAVSFSPDGRTIQSSSWDQTIRLWDAATGNQKSSWSKKDGAIFCSCFTADGSALVSGAASTVRVWDMKTGRTKAELLQSKGLVFDAAASADGRTLASCGGFRKLTMWELSDGPGGVRTRDLPLTTPTSLEGYVFHLAFSADGRTLATAGAHKWIQLWEVASGQERASFEGPADGVSQVAFSPNGKWFGVSSSNGTVLAWEWIAPVTARAAPALTGDDLSRLWLDLGGTSAARAFRAVRILASAPRPAVDFLKARLKPAAVATRERVERLMKELDSNEFTKRQQAERDLELLEDQSGEALRTALRGRLPSLEVRRRIERLVQKLDGRLLSLEQLQGIRAIEVLEHAGTPEARQLLDALAKGAPGRMTREAGLSLQRLLRK